MPYSIFLHSALVILAFFCLLLVQQNGQMRQQLTPELAQLEAGEVVEAFEAKGLNGETRILDWDASYGDRLLLVFTTSCSACKQNQTAWQSLHQSLANDLEIVGISLDNPELTLAYPDEYELPFDVVMAADREAFTSAYEIEAVPFTLHIGGDGEVRGVWRGGLSAEQMVEVKEGAMRPSKRS